MYDENYVKNILTKNVEHIQLVVVDPGFRRRGGGRQPQWG